MDCTPKYLRREAAAEYLKARYGFTTRKSLAKLASTGGGPPMMKAGGIALYEISQLDAWAEAGNESSLDLSRLAFGLGHIPTCLRSSLRCWTTSS